MNWILSKMFWDEQGITDPIIIFNFYQYKSPWYIFCNFCNQIYIYVAYRIWSDNVIYLVTELLVIDLEM